MEATEERKNYLKQTYPILRFFEYKHLPEKLQKVSKDLCELAYKMAETPINDETVEGLRKLLEAKDCFVRAALTA